MRAESRRRRANCDIFAMLLQRCQQCIDIIHRWMAKQIAYLVSQSLRYLLHRAAVEKAKQRPFVDRRRRLQLEEGRMEKLTDLIEIRTRAHMYQFTRCGEIKSYTHRVRYKMA